MEGEQLLCYAPCCTVSSPIPALTPVVAAFFSTARVYAAVSSYVLKTVRTVTSASEEA